MAKHITRWCGMTLWLVACSDSAERSPLPLAEPPAIGSASQALTRGQGRAPGDGDPASGTVLDALRFEPSAGEQEQTVTATGHFDRTITDWVYLPVELPTGVRELAVSYAYDRPAPPVGVPGNALDIGIFDARGNELGGKGFRGWSGGFRSSFSISAGQATPGYLPGPIGAGTWTIILGPYTVAPQGMDWSLTVTARFGDADAPFVPNPAPTSAVGRGNGWYRGDMHLHTVHSDGQRLPSELAAAARAARLDFIVSTEHNTTSALGIWGELAGPDLLIVDGEEITTRNGHYLALGSSGWIDWRYRATDRVLPRFLRDIAREGGLAVVAHPYCPFVGCAWKFGYDGLDALEVWNGPWTLDDEVALATWDGLLVANRRGERWLPALGNSDAHREPQVVGLPQTVVHAAALERGAILDGLRQGHAWIAESAGVELALSAAAGALHAGIGERLGADPDETVTVLLEVSGAEGGVARLITDRGQMLESALPPSGRATVAWTTEPRLSAYVRAEVRRLQPTPTTASTMVAFSNPIFLGR